MPAHRTLPLLLAALSGLIGGCAAEERPALLFERVVVHCYRTLAEPECFARPIPGQEGRLLGVGVSGYFAVPARADDRLPDDGPG